MKLFTVFDSITVRAGDSECSIDFHFEELFSTFKVTINLKKKRKKREKDFMAFEIYCTRDEEKAVMIRKPVIVQ